LIGTRHGCNGQAMIELIVGLVAVLVLFAGLLQVVSLTQARTETMVSARREAGTRAVAANANRMTPDYIRHIQVGPDRSRYSADDANTSANPAQLRNVIINRAASDPSGWTVIDRVPNNAFSALHANPNPISDFGFLNGYDSRRVELIPTIRDLVYDADSITVESEVWMPWTRGMY